MSVIAGELNKIIHEQARLKILVLLASRPEERLPFTEIKTSLAMTSGNLSIQLKTLEEAGYVHIEKSFEQNKPKTDVSVTEEGRTALIEYMNTLEQLLSGLRS